MSDQSPPGGGYGPPAGYGDQPPGYPPPGYPYGYGYGYGGYPQAEHPQGTTILVMGILSQVICAVIGPFAWRMGNQALAEIDAQPGRFSNRGQVQAGRICGIVATCLLAFQVVLWGTIFVVFVVAAATGSSS